MRGGVKRREHRVGSKSLPKEGIVAIRDMINSRGASLEMLTCGSLKGFMFVLNVLPENSEFLTTNRRSTAFNEPVTSFIVKLAVTSQNEEGLDDYIPLHETASEGIEKATETERSFFEEAKLQQHIWKSSVVGGRKAICPPVANISLFDNENGINFIKFLNYKVREQNSVHTLNYLSNVCSRSTGSGGNYGIGMIVMPKVLQSDTFSNFMNIEYGQEFQGVQVNQRLVEEVYGILICKIIRLFIETGVVHFDLHNKNALIYRNQTTGRLDVMLIDFGRASQITNGVDDEYLTADEKRPLTGEDHYGVAATRASNFRHVSSSSSLNAKTLFDQIVGYCSSHTTTHEEKYKFIHDTITALQELDHKKNQGIYGGPNYSFGRYQSSWMEELIPMTSQIITRSTTTSTESLFKKVAQIAFDYLCNEINVEPGTTKITAATLNSNCLNFTRMSPQSVSTNFLATWTELGRAIGPMFIRGIRHSASNFGRAISNKFRKFRGRGRGISRQVRTVKNKKTIRSKRHNKKYRYKI